TKRISAETSLADRRRAQNSSGATATVPDSVLTFSMRTNTLDVKPRFPSGQLNYRILVRQGIPYQNGELRLNREFRSKAGGRPLARTRTLPGLSLVDLA